MDSGDPIADCRQALLELSDDLRSAASSLRWDANPGDFSAWMIKLGPLFERAGETMRQLPACGPN